MGTRVYVELWSDDRAKGEGAIDQVMAEMRRIDELMSTYKPTSQISLVNAQAAKHPVSCSLKESCSASGYQLIVGDKHYKLDDKGNEQAKAYLEKEKAEKGANKVTIAGKLEGEKIEVTSIKGAESHGGASHDKSSK